MTPLSPAFTARKHTGRVALIALVLALAVVAAVSTFAAKPSVENEPYAVPELSENQIKALEVNPAEEAALTGETDITEQQAETIPETGSEPSGTLKDAGSQE